MGPINKSEIRRTIFDFDCTHDELRLNFDFDSVITSSISINYFHDQETNQASIMITIYLLRLPFRAFPIKINKK